MLSEWRPRIATAAKSKSGTDPKGTEPKPADAKKREAASAAARAFAIDIARLASESRCHSVVVLDVRDVSPVTDFLVLATGNSDRQMKGVSHEIENAGDEHQQKVMSRSYDENWVLLDYVDVVVHLFSQDARLYYDIDTLWGDAKRVEWK